ncbi:NUDIX hydrolase [Streptomyces sp. NPDC001937]
MPPARSGIRNLTEKYLERHPAEREQLKPLLAALEADAEPTSRAALPGHVTCSAVVIDRARRVLHIVHKASGKLLPPGGHVEDDRTLVAAALREVCEEAGIRPRDLCLIPQFLGAPIDVDVHDIDANPAKGELAHRHFDFRFAFYTTAEQTPPLVLQDEEVSGAQWLPFADVRSPTLRTKLLKAEADGLDGQPGIFTVYPPPDGDQATNTWSSGMSPAGFTSLGGAAVVEDPEGDVPEDPDEEEQATAPVTTTRPDTRADNVRRTENTSAFAKEPTGMPPRPRRYEPGGQCQGPDELAGG